MASPGLDRQEILPEEQSHREAKYQTAKHRHNATDTHMSWFHGDRKKRPNNPLKVTKYIDRLVVTTVSAKRPFSQRPLKIL